MDDKINKKDSYKESTFLIWKKNVSPERKYEPLTKEQIDALLINIEKKPD